MDLQQEFDLAIKESLFYCEEEHFNQNRKDGKYYDDEYANQIKNREFYKKKRFKSFELNPNPRYKCTPICAFASSARLCYLYLGEDNSLNYEVPLDNDLRSSSVPTKMDAKKGIINYECKCQEIVDSSHTPFSPQYLDSPLFQSLFEDFNVQKGFISIVTKEIPDKKTGKTRTVKYLKFDVKELKIDYGKAKDYAHLHFDLKQLICHLIALANNKDAQEKAVLQYIFFTPNEESINKYSKVKRLYTILEKELNAILSNGTSVSKFAEKHKIEICYERVELKKVKDFIYESLWKAK